MVWGAALVSGKLGRFGDAYPMFLVIKVCVIPYLLKDSLRNIVERKAIVARSVAWIVVIHAHFIVALVNDEGYFLQFESRYRRYIRKYLRVSMRTAREIQSTQQSARTV